MSVRFNGHLKSFYSIAEHCCNVATLVHKLTGSLELALWGLLHDASEAYIADLASPIKKGIPGYKEVENGIQDAVMKHFGLPVEEPPVVKQADNMLLITEAQVLMDPSWLQRHGHKYPYERADTAMIECWDWQDAERAYCRYFRFYSGSQV